MERQKTQDRRKKRRQAKRLCKMSKLALMMSSESIILTQSCHRTHLTPTSKFEFQMAKRIFTELGNKRFRKLKFGRSRMSTINIQALCDFQHRKSTGRLCLKYSRLNIVRYNITKPDFHFGYIQQGKIGSELASGEAKARSQMRQPVQPDPE
jgi:hypothetical protein